MAQPWFATTTLHVSTELNASDRFGDTSAGTSSPTPSALRCVEAGAQEDLPDARQKDWKTNSYSHRSSLVDRVTLRQPLAAGIAPGAPTSASASRQAGVDWLEG